MGRVPVPSTVMAQPDRVVRSESRTVAKLVTLSVREPLVVTVDRARDIDQAARAVCREADGESTGIIGSWTAPAAPIRRRSRH